MSHHRLIIPCLILITISCQAPRTITNSGKVTPKGNFVIGSNMNANLSTQTIKSMVDVVKENVKSLAGMDTLLLDDNLHLISKAATSWSLDPLKYGTDFYLRYGLFNRLDAGLKLAGGTPVIDVQYQFKGPVGNVMDNTDKRFYGSIGLQFSTQKFELPSILDEIKDRLGYQFRRTDFLVPLLFSHSFGNEEMYGSFSYGFVMNYSRISYSSAPRNIYAADGIAIQGISREENYFAFGSFINFKAGYKFVYVVPSLSVYYQDYGNYALLGEDGFSLKGWTFVPSIGLKFRIGKSGAVKK